MQALFWLEALLLALGAAFLLARFLRRQGHRAAGRGDSRQALACYRWSARLNPWVAETWSSLGNIQADRQQWPEAAAAFRRALERDPADIDACNGLGHARLREHDWRAAHQWFTRAFYLKRGPASRHVFGLVSEPKLQHDIEQLEYLLRHQLLPASFQSEAAAYREVLDEISSRGDAAFLKPLRPEQLQRIGATYDHCLYSESQLTSAEPVVNPVPEAGHWQRLYHQSRPQLICLDDFLAPAALEALLLFCHRSTIWNDYSRPNGYLAAYIDDGFTCPLLYQIAEALRRTFPEIFRDLPLIYMWAFKMDPRLAGVDVHFDKALVNVNFWLSPDEACLDPGQGGMLVYDAEAPDGYRGSPAATRAWLRERDASCVSVPYRQNRVVIFNSRLFHQSAPGRFRSGYTNRRINITLLFGNRMFSYY